MVKTTTFDRHAEVLKVDNQGLVLGWAITCKIDGEDHFDSQGDHIPEDAMLKASADFMLNSRRAGEMHARDDAGQAEDRGSIVFAFPMTAEFAKLFGLGEPQTTGLMIGMKPSDDETLAKFRDGTYTGFSIGGARIQDEEAA